jgi:hypothetical protein
MSSPYAMFQTQIPVVYTATNAYNMMVSADYYVEGTSRRDNNISASSDNLYMAPLPEQVAAVMDFLQKNADKLKDELSNGFGSFDYNGGLIASDFVDGHDRNFTAAMKAACDVGGHVDGQYLVVFSRPHHLRMVKFDKVAFFPPADMHRSRSTRGGPDAGAAQTSRGGGAGTWGTMRTLLDTM